MDSAKPNSSWLKTFSIGFSIISLGITIAIIGYIVLTTKQTHPANQQPTSASPTVSESSPTPDETVNWKVYSHIAFTFKYPPSWYPEDNPYYPGGNNVGFFLVGTKANHGYGDHKGNEVFAFEFSDENRTLDELIKNYYPTATHLNISGKPAIKTTFNLFIMKTSEKQKLNVVGGTEEGKKYVDQILSRFKFLH